ncbi:MAG: protein kinase [Gammaproteobacteria bacterium]|nr:protein kinase [Gammaproteobacteria bacterium]
MTQPPVNPTLISTPESGTEPTLLAGRYELLGEIGAGGMGRVYRARDRETGEILALKTLKPELAADPGMSERFKNELRLARRITHKNVCRIYDFNRTDALAFITMEYVEGETLRALIDRSGPLAPSRAIAIALQICAGLREAHAQGVVHRDLKPENVMIAKSGVVKLMDFGIARSVDTSTTQTIIGTPAYMAPEQAQGRAVDARTDIYALGLTLYECLTARCAFTGATPIEIAIKQVQSRPTPLRTVRPDIPPALEAAVLRCLEKEREQRFASIDVLTAALTHTTAGSRRPTATTSVTPAPSNTWRWVALTLLAIVIGGIWHKKSNAPVMPPMPVATAPSMPAIRPAPPAPVNPPPPLPAEAPSPSFDTPRMPPLNEPSFGSPLPEFDRVKAAAEAGDANAQFRLAHMLWDGTAGTRDETQARDWMERAAEQGHRDAQFALGSFYERRNDVRTAAGWYQRAAEAGHNDARNALLRLRQRTSARQQSR